MQSIGSQVQSLLLGLHDLPLLPKGIDYLNPYQEDYVRRLVSSFYQKYFNDKSKRILVLGINPGRFGGGQTGISFTDPYVLEEYCGISNDLPKRKELSSTFIYSFIDAFGGSKAFYSSFLISSICPLGFVRDGKNLNFYDDNKLIELTADFVKSSFEAHINMNLSSDVVVVLGKKNTLYFNQLNSEFNFFKKVITLEHPRYIMQYKRKQVPDYLNTWVTTFKQLI